LLRVLVLAAGVALVAAAVLAAGASARPLGAQALAETQKAPAITKNPASVTVEAGQPASFTSTASGTPAPTVQWERSTNGGASFSPIEGATSTTYSIAVTAVGETANQFRAHFTNVLGEATSKTATLTVRQIPQVTRQPSPLTVEEGQNAVFEAAATGSPAPTVAWETSSNGGGTWSPVAGATSPTLTLTAVKTTLSGHLYRAVFKNVVGSVTTEAAVLTVQKAPTVTRQPASATLRTGEEAAFEATASGMPAPAEQWEMSTDGGGTWAPIEGATSSRLTVPAVQGSQSGYRYRAVFTNAAGTVTSAPATLTVQDPPVVTEEPSGVIVEAGEPASFQAAASGFPTPTVQWQISTNGGSTWSNVEGATTDQLAIEHAQLSESGNEYRAVFTNTAGSATSAAAVLTVATTHYTAVGWGSNLFRQLGDGTTNALSASPDPVVGLRFVTAIAAGGRHSLAVLADGSVQVWGSDEFDQLGDGGEGVREVPQALPGVGGVKAIAAGANHSLALLGDGTVIAWGNNESGQLGNGTTAARGEPAPVKGLTGVKAVAAGGNHSLALMSNGTVMAWGEGESGQLGNGTLKSSSVPVTVKGLSGVRAIAAGAEFSLAVLTSGTVEAWGSNAYGQLGDPEIEETSNVPVAVGGLTGVSTVAAGANHALALLSGGTVKAWGEDAFGEIGDGAFATRVGTPQPVSGLTGVTAVSAGTGDSAALLGSGTLETWGINQSGQLGDGTTGSPSPTPVAVAGIAKVASISAGGRHMLAFGEPRPSVTGIAPPDGPVAGGGTVTISGANLTGASAVRFGSAEATTFTVESSSTITATAPPGSGTVDVTVVTPAGTSQVSTADRYTYQLPPTITKLKPTSGPVGGGTSVTITGTEFTAASAVTFGGQPAAGYKVNSSTSITAVAPPAAAGTVDVVVTNGAGTSAITTKDHFKYTPTIESVSPGEGPTAGGTSVTVTGTGFALGKATTFKFGTSKAAAVNCESSTTCTMLTPAHEAGTVIVSATVNKAKSPVSAGSHFVYH
jgi:alpha-tubulin suppressor-like RCC1 family protein